MARPRGGTPERAGQPAAPFPSAPGARRASGWRALASSFVFAWRGVVETAVHQRNMRIHLVAGLLVALLGSGLELGLAERLALLACVGLVLAAEVANSALEHLVDLVTRTPDERARAAKDAAAGAVLVLAAGSVAVLAAVLLHAGPAMRAGLPTLIRQAAIGLPLVGVAGALLLPARRSRALDTVLTWAGAALLAGVAVVSSSGLFTLLAAALFAIAAGAAARRRAEG